MNALRGRRIALALSGLVLGVACAGAGVRDEPWVYGISRSAYPGIEDRFSRSTAGASSDAEGAAIAMVLVLTLPFVLDTVLLPITIPHDLVCVD